MSETLALEAESGQKTHARSLAKGLLAGLIGGLAATAAKTLAEKVFPPRTHGEPEPPSVLAEKIFGTRLEGAQKLASKVVVAKARPQHAPGVFRNQAQQVGLRVPAAADGEVDIRVPESRHRFHQLRETLLPPVRQPEGGRQADPRTTARPVRGRCGKSVKPLSRQGRRQDRRAAIPHERARGEIAYRYDPHASASHQAALQVPSGPPP